MCFGFLANHRTYTTDYGETKIEEREISLADEKGIKLI